MKRMFIEILLGLLLSLLLMYAWFLYLKWGDSMSSTYIMYVHIPAGVPKEEKMFLDSYGWLLPPLVVSDTFKYVNFWLTYYRSKI